MSSVPDTDDDRLGALPVEARPAVCPGCGLQGDDDGPLHPYIGASAACWRRFGLLLAREYGEPERMRCHQQSVDAYAAQHPGVEGPQSTASVHGHLVSLHLVFDRGLESAFARKVIGVVTRDLRPLHRWLDPPSQLARIPGVEQVLLARDADEHCERARHWAREVWQAWSIHAPAIRALADRAMQGL